MPQRRVRITRGISVNGRDCFVTEDGTAFTSLRAAREHFRHSSPLNELEGLSIEPDKEDEEPPVVYEIHVVDEGDACPTSHTVSRNGGTPVSISRMGIHQYMEDARKTNPSLEVECYLTYQPPTGGSKRVRADCPEALIDICEQLRGTNGRFRGLYIDNIGVRTPIRMVKEEVDGEIMYVVNVDGGKLRAKTILGLRQKVKDVIHSWEFRLELEHNEPKKQSMTLQIEDTEAAANRRIDSLKTQNSLLERDNDQLKIIVAKQNEQLRQMRSTWLSPEDIAKLRVEFLTLKAQLKKALERCEAMDRLKVPLNIHRQVNPLLRRPQDIPNPDRKEPELPTTPPFKDSEFEKLNDILKKEDGN